jgi:integrase
VGVKIRKVRGKWYVFVSVNGRRKAKCVGTRAAAEQVRRVLEAKLALGDLGFLSNDKGETFKQYAERWLKEHAEINLKPSTVAGYEQMLKTHVYPRFGSKALAEITRPEVKTFLSDLTTKPREERRGLTDEQRAEIAQQPPNLLSRNTVRLALSTLRVILNHAIEDGVLERNPADKLGKMTKTERPKHEASAMTRDEAQRFLSAAQELSPELYPLFMIALRAGLRRGEVIALKWGDFQFGADESDRNRYIVVQRNFVQGKFTTPKSKKSRRVDMSLGLRRVLLQLRDERLLAAFAVGRDNISDDLVFQSDAGTPLDAVNMVHRHFEPALAKAGLRKFRFHDLRHTFGSLLIQNGASLPYVKEHMRASAKLGHSAPRKRCAAAE